MKFIIDFRFGFFKFLGSLFILFLGMGPLPCFGQVIIPIREGFPYCEPFTGTGADVRANTVFGGQRFVGGVPIDIEPTLTGESLQLTTNGNNENGYVFVDIPFPSFYGLKVSFEYSSYGRSSDIGADGFSFFMFDGSINESTFEIGGAGGALGYTARQPEPGLKGAYIGIGFDEFGNFGNYYENKRYSFLSRTDPPVTVYGIAGDPSSTPENFYSHSVVVRGPVALGDNVRNDPNLYSSYEFISGKLLNNDFGDFPGVDEEFYLPDTFDRLRIDIDNSTRVFDCDEEGYRKVFIDLQPQPGGYRISVWILAYVNGQRQVFPVIDSEYNFPPPPFLKVGFAASTGGRNNFHEIKNVTVEVSDESQLNPPIIQAQNREVCEGDQLDFEFPVDLLNAGSFVRCVQLFETEQQALNSRPSETPPGQIPGAGDCGLSGNCQLELCQVERTELSTEFGTFETFLIEESNGDFSQGIDFESNTSNSGEVTVYYTVVDNFGQVSLPKPITIVVNPLPQPEITTNDPLIWEEFEVNDIYVRLEGTPTGAGFQYQWYKDGSLLPDATNDFFLAEGAAALGNYTVEIIDEKGCFGASAEEVKISLVEDLVPDILNGVFRETCAAEGSITVSFDASSILGDEKWRIVDEDGAQVYPAGDVWNSIAAGTESVTQSNLLVGNYTFQIGDSFREGQLGSDGIPLFRHQIPFIIDPIEFPLAISVTSQDELCFEEGGSINVVAQDGNETYTYELWQNGNLISSSPPEITATTFQFSGVQVGSYEIRVGSGSRCEEFDDALIAGPTPITIQVIDFKDVTCEVNDASIEWAATGGTGNFTFVSITRNGVELGINEFALTQNGNQFLFEDLSIGNYSLTIRDQNGCEVESTSSQQINEIPKPEITISNSEDYCEGEVIILTSNLVVSGNLVDPEYTWITHFGDRITGTTTISGITYTFLDHDANTFTPPHLSISGLIAGDYEFSLELRGENSCDPGVSTDFTVNPLPVPSIVRAAAAVCFGSSDGVIEVGVGSGQTSEYEFMLDGITSYQNNSIFETGITAGTYTVFVRNKITGCEESITATISEPAELLASVNTSVDPTCGEENGLFTFSVEGGSLFTGGEAYSISINGEDFFGMANGNQDPGNIFTLSQLAHGLYEIDVRDANGCNLALEVNLTAQEIPQFEVENLIICENQPAILIAETILLAGASPVFEWYRENSAGSEDLIQILDGEEIDGVSFLIENNELIINGLSPSEDSYLFYLAISGDRVCPAPEIPVEVTVNRLPQAEFEVVDLLCHGSNTGEIQIVSSAGEYTYTLVETGETSLDGNFSGLPAGLYTVRADDAKDCFDTFTVTISQPEELILQEISQEDPTCGESNGFISFSVTGGVPEYEILINNDPISNYNHKIEGDVYSFQGLAPGDFFITVSDENACLVSLSNPFTLTNNEGFSVGVEEMSLSVCEGGIATIEPIVSVPSGALPVYRWYKDSGLLQQIISGSIEDDRSYQIDGDGSLTITGLEEGEYAFYLQISGSNICTLVKPAQITVLEPITAEVETTLITCFGEQTGTISVNNAQGGSGSFEYSIDGSTWQSSSEFTGLAGGSYSVSVRDVNLAEGCILLLNVLVDSPESEITSTIPDIFRTSCGLDNGRVINIQITGGWGDYSFEWRRDDPDNGELMTSGTLTEINDLQTGVYYLKITDSLGCEKVFEYEVGVLSDPEYQLVPVLDICEGQSVELIPVHLAPDVTLPPAAATEINWYKNSNQQDLIETGVDPSNPAISYTIDDSSWINPKLTIEGLAPGEYIYYFYVACTGIEQQITVNVFESPLPVFELDPISCAGENDGRILLVAGDQPDLRFSVNDGPWETKEQLELRRFSPGSFTVKTESDLDCKPDPKIFEFLEPAQLSIQLLESKDAACRIADGFINIQFDGGLPPYKIRLMNSVNNIVQEVQTVSSTYLFDNLQSGIFEVELEDSEGCTLYLNEPVEVADGPTEILVQNLVEICIGEQVRLVPEINPPAANKVFKWYKNSVNPSNEIVDGANIDNATYEISSSGILEISGLSVNNSPYIFQVIVTGSDICEGDQQEVQVVIFPNPEFSVDVEEENCFGEGATIVLNMEGNASNITFSLNNGPFQTYPSNTIENLEQGTYTLTARHGSGCEYSLPNPVVIEGPSASLYFSEINAIDTSCGANNGQIIGELFGGISPYSITLLNASGLEVDAGIEWSDGVFEITGVGLGTFTLVGEDANGCTINSYEQIIEDSPTSLIIDDVQVCEGEDAQLIPRIENTSLQPTFTWYRDQEGREGIPNGQSVLGEATFNLENSGRLMISGLSASSDPYLFYVAVEGTGICGDGIEEVEVLVSPMAQLRTSNPSIICDPTETVDLTRHIEGFNPDIYEYIVTRPSGTRMRLDELSSIATSGNYLVSVGFKGTNCYTPTERILVVIADSELIADFDYQINLGQGNVFVNQDVGILEDVEFIDNTQGNTLLWSWDFGDGTTSTEQNPVHQYKEKGIFTIKLYTLDEFGCSSEYQRTVQVFDDYIIEIPNAFTPSRSDGKNNFFIPKFRGVASMEFFIFNTWGELIYQTNSLEDKGWDGTLNGKPTPNGNYVYRAVFKTRAGEIVEKAGVFILIR